jgi:hypothetical protein
VVREDERQGLLDFAVAGRPVSTAELVTAGIESHVSELYVARPGKVTAYDPLTNTAVVQPMVKHALVGDVDGSRVYEEIPEIPFVPVMFPRIGSYVVTMPVPVGAPVLLLFNDVSLAEWRDGGGLSEPVDARRHSLGWPVALIGLYPDTDQMSSAAADVAARVAGMVVGEHSSNNRIEVAGSFIKMGGDAFDFVALATPTQAGINAAMAAANVAISAIGALLSTLPNHTHAVPALGTSGPGVFAPALPGAPSAGAAPGAVTATRTKAK